MKSVGLGLKIIVLKKLGSWVLRQKVLV